MSQENVEIVRASYEGVERGGHGCRPCELYDSEVIARTAEGWLEPDLT
jgi:hypothetical protein